MSSVAKIAKIEDAGKPRGVCVLSRSRRALSLAVLSAVTLTGFVGCASQKKEQLTHLGPDVSRGDQPQIISGTPQRDAVAFMQSNNQLTATDFGVIGQVAPKPVWEKYNTDRNKIENRASEDAGGGKLD